MRQINDGPASIRPTAVGWKVAGRTTMLTWEDCVGLCELTEEEIAAIARHEHLPEMAALELGQYLCKTHGGRMAIRRMILDDIDAALAAGDLMQSLKLKLALRHFVRTHRDVGFPGAGAPA
ncbi:MAG: hypothetical protein AB7O45_00330 [Alphaproteobacteria bacterium]